MLKLLPAWFPVFGFTSTNHQGTPPTLACLRFRANNGLSGQMPDS